MYLQFLKKFVENVELLLSVKFVAAFFSYSCRVGGGQHCFVNKISGMVGGLPLFILFPNVGCAGVSSRLCHF